MFRAKNFEEAVEMACDMVNIGGIGHTSGLYTDQDRNADRIKYFGDKMKTARILINTPPPRVVSVTCTTSRSPRP
jgi:acetaldehyde dehydrogenase/alcohol dehydrogenase